MTDTGITPLTPERQALAAQETDKEGYVKRNLIALDELGATILGDKNDETMSSEFARMAVEDHGIKQEVGIVMSKGLDLIEPDHGAIAIAADLERAKEVEKLENDSGEL